MTENKKRQLRFLPINQEEEETDDEEADASPVMGSHVAGCSTDISHGDCGLCWEGMTQSNSRQLECLHRFCDECLAHYLRVGLEEARVVDCPHQGCTELFCKEDLEELLTEDEFRRLQQLIFLTEVRQNPNARWCPRHDCETVCLINPSLPVVQSLKCATCQFSFCASCILPHEPRVSCRKAAQQACRRERKTLSKQDAKNRKKSVKAIKKSGCKRCPGCSLVVSKISGCNHMTCRCGREWCWICGETIIALNLHYTFSQCKGLQFSDLDGLTKAAKLVQFACHAVVPVMVIGGTALALAVTPLAAVYGVYQLSQWRREQPLRQRRRPVNRHHRQQLPIQDNFNFMVGIYGGRGVGKTAINIQFISNHFTENYHTPFDDTYRKQKIFDDESRCFEILDTAGGWENTPLRDESYHRYPHYLIVYAINSRASFDEVDSIAESIMRVRGVEWLPSTVILGNKSDLEEERQVSVVEGQQKARKYRTRFMETSAKDRINIDEAFHQLLQPWNSLSRKIS